MAMVRSSIKGTWNLSSKGVTYLYTGAKMGPSFMFGTWRRGLMSLLVLASLPFLAPVILVSMMVGGIFLVPSLCGVIAYCALFRPAALSNFIKWFRSPKSVLGSGPRSAELVMEDLDTDSEYVIVTNETDQSEPQEFDVSSLLLNASVVEIEAFELRSPSRSTAENIFEEPNAFEAVPVTEEDKIAALIAVKSMQDDEVRSSGEGSTMDIDVKPHLEQILGSDTIAREVDAADSDERATMLIEDKQQGEDDEVVNDRELNESELPAFEHVKTVTIVDYQDLSALKQVEESNRLDEGLAEAQSAYEEPAASEEPEYVVESKAVEGEGGEDHPADQVNAQRKEHEYLEESDEVKEVKERPSEVKTFEEKQQEQTETGLPEPQPVSEDSTAPVTHLEESNVDNDDSSVDHSGAGHPVLIAREQQQLEEPKFLNEGTTEAQSASEDLKAVGEPENLVESEVVEEKEDEGHTVDQLTPGKEEKRFDEYNEEIKESGQIVSASTQPFPSEEKLEHSEHVPPLRDAVQKVDDFAATEGESEPNYESAPDSFSPSENEQEQVDAREIYGRKLPEDTAHGLEGDTELNLKGVDAEEDVPVDEVDAPVVREKEVELPVSEPTLEKEVPGVQEGAVAAPALEPVAPVIEEKTLPVEEVASMADVAPVEVAAPVEEAIVKKTSEPASQVNEQEEVEAPARAPEVMKEVGAPVVEDISIVEPETTKKLDVNPAAPQVLIEDGAAIVQEKRIDIPLVVSEPTSEEKEVSAVEEEDVPAPSLKSATPAEVVASAEDSDANDLYKRSAPVVEAREVKSSAPMEDVIPERVEDSEAPGLAEKGAETFVEEAAAPETATSEASVPIAEPEVTKEVVGKLDDVSVGLEKEMGDSVLESTSSIAEQHSVPVNSEPVELASRVADVPAVAVAAPVQEASVKAATLVEGSDAKEVELAEAPMVIEKVVEPSVEEAGTSEVDSLVVEPDVAREAAAESAAPEVGAEEEVRFVQEKEAELPLVASEPVSEEREVPVVEEKDARVSSLGSGTSIKEQHALHEPVDVAYPVADVQEAAHMEEVVPVEARAEKVEFPEIPVMEDKDMKAPVAALEKVNVEESPVVVAPAQEGAAPVAEAPIAQPELTKEVKEKPAASEAVEEDRDLELPPVVPEPVTEETETPVVAEPAPALESEPVFVEKSLLEEAAPVQDTAPVREGVVEEGEKSEASEMDVKELKAPMVALQESPTSENAAPEAEAPVADVEGTKESKAGLTVPEVSVEAQTLQHKVELPSVVSEPTVEAAGVREPSISTGSVAGALVIAGKSLSAEDSIQVQQPEPPVAEKEVDAHVAETYTEEGDFGYPVESHTEQDVFPTLKPLNIIQSKDSAYDEEAKKSDSILISAPAQRRISFEGVGADDDVYMGAPLSPSQGRDRALHSRTNVSPSDSPSSPAEIGRQIREEIGTIQKIIGQEIPPQYSLWKEVETLSQIVGMELPYMGDVSDLTKARHGLDLLKVVVGIK